MNEWSESRHSPDLRCLFPLSIEQKSFNFNTSHSTYDNKFLLRRLCRFVHWLEWTNFSLSLTQLTTLFLILLLFFYYAISFMKFTHWILYFMHEWKQKNKTWNERRVSFTRILFLRICWGNQGNACLYSITDVSMKLSLK
jgi:hypothetical protein